MPFNAHPEKNAIVITLGEGDVGIGIAYTEDETALVFTDLPEAKEVGEAVDEPTDGMAKVYILIRDKKGLNALLRGIEKLKAQFLSLPESTPPTAE